MAELEVETLEESLTNGGNKEAEDMEEDSSSSDDSDDDLLLEEEEKLQVEGLERSLTENPSNYDAHVQYIKALRKLGHIDKLRQARETMSELFPLSPTMWQEWAKDEASLSSSGNEAYSTIVTLYERGVHDYLSVSLWCDYINFVQEHDPLVHECPLAGTTKIRDLFERAVPAAGLHVTEGSRIWEAYRKFEQTILELIDDSHTEEKLKQIQRIRSIFHRQLSIPLSDLRSTFMAYKSWEADIDGIPSHVCTSYEKAIEMYDLRSNYEEQISGQATAVEKLQSYMIYLKFEQSSGDPARVQILYERAVTEFPVSNDLWLDYTRYLDETLKAAKGVLDVYCRATRNCTWVGELWVRYLIALERARASEEKLSNVFEQSLQCVFSSSEEYLDLFLTRIDGLRRRMCLPTSTNDSLEYSVVRDTFQRATDYLSPHLNNTDGLLRLHAYWARLELKHGKDLVAVRGVWESLLKTSGSMLEAWKQYIEMEIGMGHIDEARRIYKRCYSKRFTGNGSEEICYSWVRFEREFGSLEDYDHAVRKVRPRLVEVELFRAQQQQQSAGGLVAAAAPLVVKKVATKEKRKMEQQQQQPTPPKRQKTAATSTEKQTTNDPPPALPAPAAAAVYKDECTVFLSNLSFQATDENLREFFSDVGGVIAIRLLKDKYTGKSRGLAYVDFSDDAHLEAALAKNRKLLMGKKVSIARSDPKQKKNKQQQQQQMKKNTTFAVPRKIVKPLGWTSSSKNQQEEDKEEVKSNDEFRKLLLLKKPPPPDHHK